MERVVIIGAGVAGLCAGIYLGRAGIPCDIYEGHSELGGNLTAWKRQGCTVDNCIHWLTGTREGNALNRLWHEVGMLDGKTAVRRRSCLYESELEGERIALWDNPLKTEEEMCTLSPADKRQIRRFIRTALVLERIDEESTWTQKAKLLLHLPDILYYKRHTLYEISEQLKHPLLRHCMTDYIGGEFSALSLLYTYATYASGNGSVPAGGSYSAAERMARVCTEFGARIHKSAPVARITFSKGRADGIVLESGEQITADYVIAACDPSVTFCKLLPASMMPRAMVARAQNKKTPVFSALQTAFVCDRASLKPFGTRIIPAPAFSSRSGDRLPVREYSHEESFAPEGKVILQTLVFQTEGEAEEWIALRNNPTRYREKKEEIAKKTKEALSKAFPELAPSLSLLDVWTPATYHRYFDSRAGAFLSYAMTPHAPMRTLPTAVPNLKAFSLATQWLASPGGLPAAATTGRSAANDAIRYLCRKRRSTFI